MPPVVCVWMFESACFFCFFYEFPKFPSFPPGDATKVKGVVMNCVLSGEVTAPGTSILEYVHIDSKVRGKNCRQHSLCFLLVWMWMSGFQELTKLSADIWNTFSSFLEKHFEIWKSKMTKNLPLPVKLLSSSELLPNNEWIRERDGR